MFAFALSQRLSGTLYGIIDGRVDLILYGTVCRPSACHDHLASAESSSVRFIYYLSTMGCFLSNSSGVKEKQAGAKPAACSIPQCGTL
jgi:hypothetical protein